MLNSVYTMSGAKLNKKLVFEMISNDIRARKYRKITFVYISTSKEVTKKLSMYVIMTANLFGGL